MIYLLVFYIVFLFVYVVFSGIAVYHLNRFGYFGDLTKPVMFIYLLLSIAVIAISIVYISTLQWPQTLTI